MMTILTVASFTGDGAYDQQSVYVGVTERHPEAAVIMPPRSRPADANATVEQLWSADEAETLRARNGLGSPLDVELDEDALDVRFDGLGCDGKNSSDLLVGVTLRDQMEDLALPAAERLRNCGRSARRDLSLVARLIAVDEAIDVSHEIWRISGSRGVLLNALQQTPDLGALIQDRLIETDL